MTKEGLELGKLSYSSSHLLVKGGLTSSVAWRGALSMTSLPFGLPTSSAVRTSEANLPMVHVVSHSHTSIQYFLYRHIHCRTVSNSLGAHFDEYLVFHYECTLYCKELIFPSAFCQCLVYSSPYAQHLFSNANVCMHARCPSGYYLPTFSQIFCARRTNLLYYSDVHVSFTDQMITQVSHERHSFSFSRSSLESLTTTM